MDVFNKVVMWLNVAAIIVMVIVAVAAAAASAAVVPTYAMNCTVVARQFNFVVTRCANSEVACYATSGDSAGLHCIGSK